MTNEKKYDLFDLYEKIHDENTAKQEALLRIKYVPKSSEDSRLMVSADLKPTIVNDASYYAESDDGELVYFDLLFRENVESVTYETYLFDTFENRYNDLEDDIMKKHYIVLFALINPKFILHLINKKEHIEQLIQNEELIIELNDANLIIEIYREKLVF